MPADPVAVILPAAGKSTRFGGTNKLTQPLAGQTVLLRTLAAFLHRPDVPLILIAGDIPLDSPSPKIRHSPGGPTRAHSVRNALSLIPPDIQWVAIHDAARPLISQSLIDRTFAAAFAHGAAAPALPVSLTIKEATGPLPAPVHRTLPRHSLWAMQTPQVMRCADLVSAFAQCPLPLDQITDDTQLLELAAIPVQLIEGEDRNLKITTPQDLSLAELLLREHPDGGAGTLACHG